MLACLAGGDVRIWLRVSGYDAPDMVLDAHKIAWAEFLGNRYGYGDPVFDVVSSNPISLFQNDINRYGSEHHIFHILVTMALMKAPENTLLWMVAAAPPSLVGQATKQIRDAVMKGEDGSGNGTWSIRMSHRKKPFVFQFEQVLVFPEGVPAYAAYRFLPDGAVADLSVESVDLLGGNTYIADAGRGTFDGFNIVGGNIDPETIQHATDSNGGIETHIIQPVLDEIRSITGSTHVSSAHVDRWLRRWVNAGFDPEASQVMVSGNVLHLHSAFTAARNRYADWLINHKFRPALKDTKTVVLATGGGWTLLENRFLQAFPNHTLLTPTRVAHLHNVDLWNLNAYGALVLIRAQLRREGKA